jgi:hypothetical protein
MMSVGQSYAVPGPIPTLTRRVMTFDLPANGYVVARAILGLMDAGYTNAELSCLSHADVEQLIVIGTRFLQNHELDEDGHWSP